MGLGELGFPRTLEEVKKAYFNADIRTAMDLLPRAPFPPESFRETFSSHFFKELGLLDQAPEIAPRLFRRLMELRPKRVIIPGAKEIIEKLHHAGYPLGLISNNDGFTKEKCEKVGIDQYFFFILDSTVEGLVKPDPRIFLKGLAMAGVKSGQTLHIGDLWGCDVLGAAAAGIPAVWFKNEFVDPEPVPGSARIKSLTELLELLEH